MSLTAFDDPRLRSVPWRDLVPLRTYEIALELLLPLPWLAGSLVLASLGWYLPALPLSFLFFLAGLRVVHNAYHYALGLPRAATEAVMAVLSLLMLGSMHAVQFNHLRHHKHCLGEGDVEGMCARLRWWQALLVGPWFPLRMHLHALTEGNPRVRRWVVAELVACAAWIGVVFFIMDITALRYHVLTMVVGQCLTGFFAVWTVHHDCESTPTLSRTLRGRLRTWLSFSMFFHVEHHLFPRVPTCRLGRLAERLDAVAPEWGEKRVLGSQ